MAWFVCSVKVFRNQDCNLHYIFFFLQDHSYYTCILFFTTDVYFVFHSSFV